MAFRTRHKVRQGKNIYVIRDRRGKFVGFMNINRSIRADTKVRALHRPRKRRQGFLGDYRI